MREHTVMLSYFQHSIEYIGHIYFLFHPEEFTATLADLNSKLRAELSVREYTPSLTVFK